MITCLLLGAVPAGAHDDNDRNEDFPQYKLKEIAPPDDPRCAEGYQRSVYARRMNKHAQVAGNDLCYRETGDPNAPLLPANWAFTWTRAEQSVILPSIAPDSLETYARDINDAGTLVGWEFSFSEVRAPIWPATGGVTEITPFPCFNGSVAVEAESINEQGAIAYEELTPQANGSCRFGWKVKLASGEVIAAPVSGQLTAMNDNNALVGAAGNNAVKWSVASGPVTLYAGSATFPLTNRGQAWGINNQEQVVGVVEQYVSPNPDQQCLATSQAMSWDADATPHVLPSLRGDLIGFAFSINKHGTIVGYSQSVPAATCNAYDPFPRRAVIWRNNKAKDLNKLIPRRFRDEIQLIQASWIDNRGRILARGIRPAEPLAPCPNIGFDPVTQTEFYDTSLLCANEYSFLLTPKDD